jgi:hypothetical protein
MSKKMQTPEEHHEEVVRGLSDQLKPVLDSSEQPIYIYLDDNHKACNNRFANLLGYESPMKWAEIPGFLEVYVAEKSRDAAMKAYWNAMKRMVASLTQVTWMKKDGGMVDSTVILVPIFFQGIFSRCTS